jgi:hypothetical protein
MLLSYTNPYFNSRSTELSLKSQAGERYPFGLYPASRRITSLDLTSIASSLSRGRLTGDSWAYPWQPISCPSLQIRAHKSGYVSIVRPGMNHVALIRFSPSRSSNRSAATAPNSPLDMGVGVIMPRAIHKDRASKSNVRQTMCLFMRYH